MLDLIQTVSKFEMLTVQITTTKEKN